MFIRPISGLRAAGSDSNGFTIHWLTMLRPMPLSKLVGMTMLTIREAKNRFGWLEKLKLEDYGNQQLRILFQMNQEDLATNNCLFKLEDYGFLGLLEI